MNKCKKNILIIFGLLLIVAISFVPYTNKITGEEGWTILESFYDNRHFGYEMNTDMIVIEMVLIIFTLGFAYLLFCIVQRRIKRRKIEWKKNLPLLVGWISIILIISILLTILKHQIIIMNIIHAASIITLIFITLFFIIQTEKLINLEKISFEIDKKKRRADFEERRLQDFYLPLRYKTDHLELLLKKTSFYKDSIIKLAKDIVGLFSKYGYMTKRETEKGLLELLEVLIKIEDIKEEELMNWKKKALVKLEKIRELNNSEITDVKNKINEVYRFKITKIQKETRIYKKQSKRD